MNRNTLFFLSLLISLPGMHAFSQERQVQWLSGTDAKRTVKWDFFCTAGRNSGTWSKIDVPSCWELQGFGNYNYGRDYKTNGKNARFYDEKGLYKHSFRVPLAWKGRIVKIVFEGSMTDTEVKINGRTAGPIHQGAFYRFAYDVSSLLNYDKENTLEVTVSKMSADASVNNAERLADYWVLGGIFRPVYLEMVPKQHLEGLAIDARADGTVKMEAGVKGVLRKGNYVTSTITDLHNKAVHITRVDIKPGDSLTTLSMTIPKVRTWTSETPSLYLAQVALFDASGQKLFQVNEKFGFRTIEIRRGNGVFVNGTQVKFKGVNRHCWWPETGRALSDEQQLQDVLLLKEMNMNAVRCSHYPPDRRFLELCDSLGIYVIDELAGWQKFYSTQAGAPLVKEMVLRDRNHPSIVFWANGNEGGTNKELDDDFVNWDFQKRPVIHPHHRPGNQFNGIDCNHYEDYYSTKKILDDSLIYMPTEFLHAQDDGGGGAAMHDFWELHWNAPRSAGGFIWAMVDEAVVRTDLNNALDANGLNANDGILGPHREKEGSYYALRKVFSPVKLALEAQLSAGFEGRVGVENRYHFLNLSECTFYWALVDFSGPFDRFDGYVVKQKGKTKSPPVPPHQKGELLLDLPSNYKNYDALVVVARDNFGKEIYKWTSTIKGNPAMISGFVSGAVSQSGIKQTDSTYVLSGGEVTIMLDRKTGGLLASKNTSNDYLLSFNGGPQVAGGSATIAGSQVVNDKTVEFTYTGDLKYARWTMQDNGWVALEYEYRLEGDLPFAGISFNYPENYVLASRWLGKGPSRQWKNRLEGAEVNVWQNLYNNTHTGYSPVVYPEFKGYYGEVTWMELSTVEGKLYIASKEPGLFVRLFDFYALSSSGKPHPDIPPGNISFLDHIPPIGTKLAMGLTTNTKQYGPRSELNHVSGTKKRTLYFYFGMPKTITSGENYTRPLVDDVF